MRLGAGLGLRAGCSVRGIAPDLSLTLALNPLPNPTLHLNLNLNSPAGSTDGTLPSAIVPCAPPPTPAFPATLPVVSYGP